MYMIHPVNYSHQIFNHLQSMNKYEGGGIDVKFDIHLFNYFVSSQYNIANFITNLG